MTISQLRELNLDLEALGLLWPTGDDGYFCTPENARILFRTGVDGIHYCRVRGFGSTIFAVEPMTDPEYMVLPVAESLDDFLRLVMTCGGESAVQQAYMWDRGRFDAFLGEYPPDARQQSVIAKLRQHFAPMDDPYGYISILQNGMDMSGMKFKPEYYDVLGLEAPSRALPAWEVYFDGNFWGHSQDRSRPGKEIPVGKTFTWAQRQWYVPAVYVCGKGLVVDVCQQSEAADITAFIEKWNLLERDGRLSQEEQEQVDRENPMHMDCTISVTVNGTQLRQYHGCGIGWNPCLPDHNEEEIRLVMEHYGLDAGKGWYIQRRCFPWATKRAPKLGSLSLTMTADEVDHTAGTITVTAQGEMHTIRHPLTGEEYTIRAETLERGTMSEEVFRDEDAQFPRHYIGMEFTVTPTVDKHRLQLRDTHPGDRPRRKNGSGGIIGSGFGLIPILRNSGNHAAISSLTFEPRNQVQWRVVFRETPCEPVTIQLI